MTDIAPAPSNYFGRRLAGLAIDWVLSMIISAAFFTAPGYADSSGIERFLVAGEPNATLAIWAAQHLILVATLGTTIGHRIMGLRVVRDDGAPYVGIVKAFLRTLLLALVIPAVVTDGTGRGYHDRAAGTRIVRTRGDAS